MRRPIYCGVRLRLWLCLGLVLASGCSKQASTEQQRQSSAVVDKVPDGPLPSQPLVAGGVVNDFRALAHTGERVRLSRYLQRPVVVYFCAQDSAPSCTELAVGFRDQWLHLNAQLGMVFGVSQEDMQTHSAFGAEQKLPFLLLSDSSQQLEKTFGLSAGTTVSYLIGTDRKVLRVFNAPRGAEHANEVKQALTELGLSKPDYPN